LRSDKHRQSKTSARPPDGSADIWFMTSIALPSFFVPNSDHDNQKGVHHEQQKL